MFPLLELKVADNRETFIPHVLRQGPGLTVIRPLTAIKHKPLFLFAYSESDFYSPHYGSVWPNNNKSDLSRYLLRLSTYNQVE